MNDRPLFVCLDIQRAFLARGPFMASDAGAALISGRRMLAIARERNWRIVHCLLYRPEAPLCIDGNAARPIDGFEPLRDEIVLKRASLSAYSHEAFAPHMASAAAPGALVTSLSASLTFLATMLDAFTHGHGLVVAEDALAAQTGLSASAKTHLDVTCDLAALMGIPVISSGEHPLQLASTRSQNGGTQT